MNGVEVLMHGFGLKFFLPQIKRLALVCHPERSRRAFRLDVGFDFAQPDKLDVKIILIRLICGKHNLNIRFILRTKSC